MSEMENKLLDCWSQVEQVVERLLKERQELIVLLCKIDGLEEYTSKKTPTNVKIKAFCQILMDYVSAGHFEVYEKLMAEGDVFGDTETKVIENFYPKIEQSTGLAVTFNDKYETVEENLQDMGELQRDLSALGEALEERFQLEDELIEHFHNKHKLLLQSA